MRVLIGIIVSAVLAAATLVMPQSWAQGTFPWPVVTVTTLVAGGQQIIGQNPSRRTIRICNTSATIALWIWPYASGAAATTLVSAYILAPVASNVITCYVPPAGTGTDGARAGAQWAASPSGAAGSVSVEEW